MELKQGVDCQRLIKGIDSDGFNNSLKMTAQMLGCLVAETVFVAFVPIEEVSQTFEAEVCNAEFFVSPREKTRIYDLNDLFIWVDSGVDITNRKVTLGRGVAEMSKGLE